MNIQDPSESSHSHPLPELFPDARWHQLAEHLSLSRRQQQIARLVCRGCSDRQVGNSLGISENTVHTHLRLLFKRLEVHDRVGVVVRLVLTERQLSARPTQAGRRHE